MNQTRWLLIAIALGCAVVLTGCDSNATNEPTADAIKKANEDRAKKIDEDPTMTPEGKAKMKEMLHLNSAPTDGGQGRKK